LKKTLLISLAAVLLVFGAFLSGCSKKSPEKLETKVAAEVNGTKISSAEVEAQLASVLGSHASQFQGEEGQKMIEQFRKQILEQLIEFELIVQQAEKEGIKVTDDDVKKRIDDIKKQFQSDADFKAALSQAGITEAELPEKVKKQLLAEKMLEKLFKDIKVEDPEMKDYYEKNKNSFYTSETAEMAHVMVADEETAKKVISEIKGGLKFEEAVKKYSTDSMTKNNNGSFGLQTKAIIEQMFGPDFANAVFSLKEGEVYEKPLVSASGYHVVKLLKKVPAHLQTFEEAKENIKNLLLQKKQNEVYTKWIDEIKKKAKIKRYI
jgi:parvulin-like peptidyl-prolyl isomerase